MEIGDKDRVDEGKNLDNNNDNPRKRKKINIEKKRKSFPTRSEIIAMIKDTNKTIMRDTSGRLYGILKDNNLFYHLKDTGIVDESNTYLMWTMLPTRRKLGSKLDELSGDITSPEQLLDFPMEDEVQDMFDYRTGKGKGRIQIIMFPERNKKTKRKIDAVVVKLLSN